jgi:hypothetical protein
MGCDDTMKAGPLLIGIIVILAVVGSPVLAISKSELISQYKTGYFPGPTSSTPTQIPTTIPTIAPTYIPTGTGTGTILVTSNSQGADVYLDGVYKGVTPERVYGSGAYIRGAIPDPLTLTGIPAGLHQLKVTKKGYGDYSRSVTVTGGESTFVFAYLKRNSPTEINISAWSIPSKEELYGPTGVYDPGYLPGFNSSYADDLPSKGKPNIYLYSDRDLTAQVRLAPEYAITVSEPVYQPGKGWRAEIRNGSLNGKGDFLFYEALGSDYEWQKEEGYIIRAAYREQDMAFMLRHYGFNQKETVEFIDYWASHLIEDMDFVFYPQETAAVNQDMPLYITPKPDHVMRIWFCAEPLMSAPEPVKSPEKIVREGFYVVEWGVIIDDEYWINHSPASSEVVL